MTITVSNDHTTIRETASSTVPVYGIEMRDSASRANVEKALLADATSHLHRTIEQYLATHPTSRDYDLETTVQEVPLSSPDLVFHDDASITRHVGLASIVVTATASLPR